MIKKIFFSIVYFSLLFLLAACPSRMKKDIRIGFIDDFSEENAANAVDSRAGIMIGIELLPPEIVQHVNFTIINLDSNSFINGEKVLGAEVESQNLDVIVSATPSTVLEILLQQMKGKENIPVIAVNASSPVFYGKDDQLFMVNNGLDTDLQHLAKHLQKKLQLKRIASIYDLSNPLFTESWVKKLNTFFTKNGGQISVPVAFDSRNKPYDLEKIAEQLLANQPDGVMMALETFELATIVQELWERNSKIVLVSSDWGKGDALLSLAGPRAKSIYFVAGFNPRDKNLLASSLNKKFTKRYGRPLTQQVSYGFDAFNFLTQAVMMKGEKSLINRLKEVKSLTCADSQKVSVNRFGEMVRKPYVYQLKDILD